MYYVYVCGYTTKVSIPIYFSYGLNGSTATSVGIKYLQKIDMPLNKEIKTETCSSGVREWN